MESFDPFVTFIFGIFTGAIIVGIMRLIEESYDRRQGLGRPAELVKPPALTRYPSQPARIVALREILDEEMLEEEMLENEKRMTQPITWPPTSTTKKVSE